MNSDEAAQLRLIEEEGQRTKNQLLARRANTMAAEAAERGQALKLLQDSHVHAVLARTQIATARFDGIGRKLKERLIAHGISTAATWTGGSNRCRA